MKITKKAISVLLVMALAVSMLCVSVVSGSAELANPYSEAAMNLDREYAYDGELGAIYSPEATTFKVWAPLATEVKLNRYTDGDGGDDLGTTEMEKLMDGDSWTGVWTTTVQGDIVNTYYTYSITNPNKIYNGKFSQTHETQDVYSYAVGVNGDRSMVVDLTSSETNPDGWENDSHVFTDNQTDAIVWAIQVKDFSYAENSGVSDAYRGKFMAFTESTTLDNAGQLATCVDYLKELGVTHVQINPFYDFATIDEAGDPSQFNWGYDPKNYGVPEGSYSTDPYDGNVRIKECKAMIQALHEAGIGVIMDVVYNHTYSVDSCFNYTVPQYYYRITASGGYSQQSGCGNDTASERAMYRKYMRDMLTYWTNEYHIDGYRFDLMGVHDGETMNLIREDMDAIDPRIIMYGEGWSGDTVYDPTTCSGTETFMTVQANANKLSERIGFFNDSIRDGLKGKDLDGKETYGFASGNKANSKSVSIGVNANTMKKTGWQAVSPEQCVTYASCHDNMTLHDKLVAGNYGESADYLARYADIVAQNKLVSAIVSSSQGIDFILAGEEMGRSKDGDENSYKSAATLNMIDWSLIKTNADIVSYYKGMFELRKAFSPFTATVKDSLDDSYEYIFETSTTTSVSTIAYTVHNNTEGEWNKIAVIYNGKTSDVTLTFKGKKDATINADTEWVIVANDKAAGVTSLGETKGLTFSVPASSAIIAVEKSTFEACEIQSDFTKVFVDSVYDKDDSILASTVLLGRPGTGYSVTPDLSIPLDYTLSHTEGEENGVFSDGDTHVRMVYKDYVPEVFLAPNGDLDDSGRVDIVDVTVLQRHVTDIKHLDDEHLARADYDLDGKVDIVDTLTLQRFTVDLIKPVCTVITHHIDKETGTELVTTSTERMRYGTVYDIKPASIAYYVPVEIPSNASGVITHDVTIDYTYEYSVASPILHIKHAGSDTWNPSLWAWAYDENGKAIDCYAAWPGKTLTSKDADGWYTEKLQVPGGLDYYFVISNNGDPQTIDYGPISYDEYPECWIVIDNSSHLTKTDWCTYYNYNPDLAN